MSRSNEILTTHQVAEKLGVNPVTVARWVKAGKLPAFKTAGGHRRIRKEDLDRFLQECGYFDTNQPEQQTPAPAAVEPGTRVLIVDDEPDIVELIGRTIEDLNQGYVVKTANDGFMAGWLIRSYKPSVIFLDLRMEGVSGTQVCKLVKSEEATADSYVIAVSGFLDDEGEKIRAAGAAECIAKPIGPTDIREALARANAAITR